jgi:hypothetical protein
MPTNGNRPGEGAAHSVGELYATELTRQPAQPQADIARIELVGTNRATAFGLTVNSYAPFCQICRKLIRADLCPDLPVEAYRGGTLPLRAPSLQAAAQLTVEDSSGGPPRFRRYRPPTWAVAPPIAQNAPGAPGEPPAANNAPCARPRVLP